MNHIKVLEAKKTLDKLLGKQRVALYKPIQIAEILYRVRHGELSINDVRHNLEAYRNPSKRWRDSVTRLLIDQVSTSSSKYQDNLFESNANNLRQEFRIEFPYSTTFESFYREREYDRVPKSLSQFWQSD